MRHSEDKAIADPHTTAGWRAGSSGNSAPRHAALVVAHPGHELRVHHWLERTRAKVLVLTDGSGGAGASRLASTTAVLARTGAVPGPLYGRLSDRALYAALLAGDLPLFRALAAEIVAALRDLGAQVVAGDAIEGYNPSHDVCRLLVDAAVARLAAEGLPVANLEFPLDAAPEPLAARDREGGVELTLDDAALDRKLAAAFAYPELREETEAALARFGPERFRLETLRPARSGALCDRHPMPPYYETYGERQVAAGRYSEVLRCARHVEPVALDLAAWAADGAA
ncbi:MAG TPA: hypothetical protein VGE98_09110 [Thermoanaerobaculia bacterium]